MNTSIQDLVRSIFRTRVLKIHSIWRGMPYSLYKKYLILGSDQDITDFSNMVTESWPVQHNTFLI